MRVIARWRWFFAVLAGLFLITSSTLFIGIALGEGWSIFPMMACSTAWITFAILAALGFSSAHESARSNTTT